MDHLPTQFSTERHEDVRHEACGFERTKNCQGSKYPSWEDVDVQR